MKLYIFKGPTHTELIACKELPGKGSEPTMGLTYRAELPELASEAPTSVQLFTGCWQSFESDQYSELDLVTFRKIKARMQNGFDEQWHAVSQQFFPEIWMSFEYYDQRNQEDRQNREASHTQEAA